MAVQNNETSQTQKFSDGSSISFSFLPSHIKGGVIDQEENHNLSVSQEDAQVTTESEEQSTTKSGEPLTTKSKQEVELSDCIPSVNDNDLKMLSVLDFAGQSAYYACHHIFYSPRAFFILVVDMTKKLDSPAIDACKTEDQDLIYGTWKYEGNFFYFFHKMQIFTDAYAKNKLSRILLTFEFISQIKCIYFT